jgi:6-pyruvoyltetrahydropterin/6-carboxytetrahydropterin synthase
MVKVTRRLEFDAEHRVYGHESKCQTVHEHRYVVLIEAAAPQLDSIGRVIDFSVLKEKIGSWIDEAWDHTFLVWENDEEVRRALHTLPRAKDPFVAPWNPTAENMAEWLLHTKCPELLKGTGVTVTKVTVYETPNCSAEASLD